MKNKPIEHLIVIGASSGGVEVLTRIIGALPADLPAAVCVVLHLSPESPGAVPRILAHAGVLPVEEVAVPHGKLMSGRIYVAPADHHLIVEPARVHVSRGPRENRFRPAIDPLFRSAAQVYGPRVIGVLLSGSLDDGTAGLWSIKQLGGIAVVQDPADAMFPSMPESALKHVSVDHCAPAADIGPLLVRLTATSVQDRELARGDAMDVEVRIAAGENAHTAGIERISTPSPFACRNVTASSGRSRSKGRCASAATPVTAIRSRVS
jgi:two-component system chemotaxis response regulator CheB